MLRRLRQFRERRSGRKAPLADDEAARRRAELELREAERRMAEQRQRIESPPQGPW
ncbi:MAG: hypothetical protein ACRDOG_14545 [Gaiellaceae bacterium]